MLTLYIVLATQRTAKKLKIKYFLNTYINLSNSVKRYNILTDIFIASNRTYNMGNKPNTNLTGLYISTLFYVLYFKF